MKDEHDLIRPTNVEMVPNHPFKPHPARWWPVEHTGVGHLELAGRHLVSIAGPDVGVRKGRGQTSPPPPEKALHRTGSEAITYLLQSGGITAATESIIESFIGDTGFLQLPFGPLVAIEPKPDGPGRIGIRFPERRPPLRIPEIKIEMIDIGHLAAPIHVRVARLLLPFPRPRSPDRCFLLR
jgi:hypothetical protein